MSDDFSLFDLFREEVRGQTATLSHGLLELEGDAGNARRIEPLMRAAHSIKGAARIVNVEAAVGLAHVMEDALVAAQEGKVLVTPADVDVLLRATDLLSALADVTEATAAAWGEQHRGELDELEMRLRAIVTSSPLPLGGSAPRETASAKGETASEEPKPLPTQRERGPGAAPSIPREPIQPGDDQPMFDLFREELRVAALSLCEALDSDASGPGAAAAQAIKGAARVVGLSAAADLAAVMEDALTAEHRPPPADDLRAAVALLAGLIERTPEAATEYLATHLDDIRELQSRISRPPQAVVPVAAHPPPARLPIGPPTPAGEPAALPAAVPAEAPEPEAVVRVTARSLNRLMSLAGESLVQARWLQPFATALLKLKKHQDHLGGLLDSLADALAAGRGEQAAGLVSDLRGQSALCRQVLGERLRDFEDHAGQAEDLNSRLYREVIVSRMRPFSDGAHGFPRLVRDMARATGKQIRLDIDGLHTEVDRDILERLEAPLTHLIRNSVDHGVEPPEARRAAGKAEQAVVRLDVRHRAGMLAITVSDDGGGIDLDRLRRKIVDRGLSTADLVAVMTEAELLEFLFLPGFSTAAGVTEYSGRGVGLDVVQTTIRKTGGSVRVATRLGHGTSFHLQLPITLSVLRAVLVDIAGEPYAFPHNRIDRLIRVPRDQVRSLEHRQFVAVDGQNVGLVVAAQLLDLTGEPPAGDELPVLLMSDDTGVYGLIVEAFRGEQDLVVRPLDPRLGKVPNVSTAALLDDGAPVLIADVEDLIRSMDHFIQSGSLRRCDTAAAARRARKRVLVVDDSITVREVERQLLRNHGYDVEVAVDGKDGWNQVRFGGFDLVVSDVDMPRMNGLDLVKAIREDGRLKALPIIIVSYKDREADRLRGLELGANYYLTKSSFHDDTFLRAVADLIGEA